MKRNYMCLHCIVLLFFIETVDLLNNGLALRPPMGWMSWGYYECGVDCKKDPNKCLNEKLIKTVADRMYDDGYMEAGYEYIVIDDCWSEMKRDGNGRLVPDRKRFPNGMKYLADYIHSKGLKFGMYTNVGKITCKGYPASLYHMREDANTFAEWDVDYLKVDGCFVGLDVLDKAYIELGRQLNKTGRPMVYSCSWPYYIKFIVEKEPDFKQISSHCNIWRDFHDIFPNWGNAKWVINYYENQTDLLSKFHKSGQWFDPDMLLVGRNALTEGQNRIQIAVYSMLSAPLIISADMERVTPGEKALLTDLDLMAIAQDLKGVPAKPYKLKPDVTVWVKPHNPYKSDIHPSFSFAFVNMRRTTEESIISLRDYGLTCEDGYTVYDLFNKIFVKNVTFNDELHARTLPNDVVLYTLYPL